MNYDSSQKPTAFNFLPFARFIHSLLGCSEAEIKIKAQLSSQPITVSPLWHEQTRQCIELQKDSAIILCLLRDGICTWCICFPGDPLDRESALQACSQICLPFKTGRWLFRNSVVRLAGDGNGIGFCFYRYL